MKASSQERRTVLITGGSSGFGRAMVTEFLREGWDVITTVRQLPSRREQFRQELLTFPNALALVECDVTSSQDRRGLFDRVRDRNRGLDCLINNAGYMLLGPLETTTEQEICNQMETNFLAPVFLTQGLLPFLRARRGLVINVSSIFGFTTWPMTSSYCASKYALEGFSSSLRQELREHGVRVAILEPGSFPTSLMANLRWGSRTAESRSVYAEQTNAYFAFRQSLARRLPGDLSVVARAAVRIANTNGVSLRTRVGIDAKLLYFAARLFPELFGVRIMNWLARRMFQRADRKPTTTHT